MAEEETGKNARPMSMSALVLFLIYAGHAMDMEEWMEGGLTHRDNSSRVASGR